MGRRCSEYRLSGRACSVSVALALADTVARAVAGRRSSRRLTPHTQQFRTLKEGKNADYIPALAKVDPNLFGIALVTADGKVYTAGDVKTEVSIQSISKVFTMAQVIQEQGLESIEKRIGVDATGARFNSIIAVEAVRTVSGDGSAGDEPAGESGRDLGDEHGDGSDVGCGVGEDHRLPQRRRGTLS